MLPRFAWHQAEVRRGSARIGKSFDPIERRAIAEGGHRSDPWRGHQPTRHRIRGRRLTRPLVGLAQGNRDRLE